MTGVVQPAPLAKLNELLGSRIASITRFDGRDGRTWHLMFEDGPRRLYSFKTFEFRTVSKLNQLARLWGRDPDRPGLTKKDALAALRLMHEHCENTPGGVITASGWKSYVEDHIARTRGLHGAGTAGDTEEENGS